jgi:sugar/nucleoside kinase (ribokinase family)
VSAVAVIGSLSLDVVAGAEPRPGGAVFYGARALARVRATARVVARCAARDAGRLATPLEALGLPTTFRAGERTTAFSFHYEGDHRVMYVDGVGDPWTESDVENWARDGIGDAGWVQVGALLRTDFGAPTLAALARGGKRLLIDAQGLVRLGRTGPLTRDDDVDPEIFPSLSALKLNEDEARILVGGHDPDQLRSLGVPEVLVTLGSAGALVVTRRLEERISAIPVGAVVDPTGAGDSFSAVYLWSRACGAEPVEAAREANETTAALLSGSLS